MANNPGIKLEITNAPEFSRELRRASEKVVQAAEAALYRQANVLINDSVPRVPWDTGVLKGSHFVGHPETGADGVLEIEFGYGGAASAYALIQHEREDFNHPRGGEAKYLKKAIDAHLPTMDAELSAHVRWFIARQGPV